MMYYICSNRGAENIKKGVFKMNADQRADMKREQAGITPEPLSLFVPAVCLSAAYRFLVRLRG